MSKTYFELRVDLESQLNRLKSMKSDPKATPEIIERVEELEQKTSTLIEIVKLEIEILVQQGLLLEHDLDQRTN